MPNWCYNQLIVKSKNKKDLEGFVKKYFTEEELDFNKVIPQPKKNEGLAARYLVSKDSHIQLDEERPWFNWYEWNCDNWGTKWNSCETWYDFYNSLGYEILEINFNTAWAPPKPVIEKLIRDNPHLKFKFKYDCEC